MKRAWERAEAREEQYRRLREMRQDIVMARITINHAIKEKFAALKIDKK